MWFRVFKKSKPDCFAPEALIGPAFSFRASANVTREAEVGYPSLCVLQRHAVDAEALERS
jgi:hypothetical protein